MFPISFIGQAFKWYSTLPPHSIENWASMEEKILILLELIWGFQLQTWPD